MNHKHNTALEIKSEDIPLYKKLGFRPQTTQVFYAKAIVSFFKKVAVRQPDEGQALRTELSLFTQFMENERFTSWEECQKNVWEKLLTFSYIDLDYEQTQSKAQSFYKTILDLARWLDEHEKHDFLFASGVEAVEAKYQEEVLSAIRVLEIYRGKVENPFLTGYEDIRRETLLDEVGSQRTSEGVFEIVDLLDETMELKSLLTKKTFTVHVSKLIANDVHLGTTFIGVLNEAYPNQWEILTLDRVFPPTAKSYLYKNIGIKI
ncbi:hypothetical protein JOD43_001144 [Pullulanibacillus pueri]|uniref:Uncharacterized protein n=1 Tax=Pullulanibacillus pueri TaxID=1437324 RepID=A0A8J3ENC5_9BACL|nr:hypothetical protein [Pullulanibacillus pueri]MBM7680978.1 hypothetical protein [Pullulanibacillus pueri]GGH86204.1 hypothetical protein GCM10007096_33360 [Pullulanibacillus pueri]